MKRYCHQRNALVETKKMAEKMATALERFMMLKNDIDERLRRLQEFSDEHFNCDPDDIKWGDVGDLIYCAERLKDLTDSAFHEGEYAEVGAT